eukprot:1413222-Karenia_brevis.AAC.1
MTKKIETLENKVALLAQTLGETVQASVEQRVQTTMGGLKEDVLQATQVKHGEFTAVVRDNNEAHTKAVAEMMQA